MRSINLEKEIAHIVEFIRDYFQKAGFTKAILGLSGGLDSAVSAALAAKALGGEKVTGFIMPYFEHSKLAVAHATELALNIGIKHETIWINGWVDPYFEAHARDASALRKGNWMARARMCVLYDKSVEQKALVVGTGNRSELLVGYFTQWGDSACAFEPIGHLYKTEVRAIAKLLNLPKSIIEKAPTADLWANQTDEEELGIDYPVLDKILYDISEQGVKQWSTSLPYSQAEFELVDCLVKRSKFKLSMPPMPELSC